MRERLTLLDPGVPVRNPRDDDTVDYSFEPRFTSSALPGWFIEVRARSDARHGGAAASVSATKRARIVRTAQHYLMSLPSLPPCRFDVVAVQGDVIEWLRGAFDSS